MMSPTSLKATAGTTPRSLYATSREYSAHDLSTLAFLALAVIGPRFAPAAIPNIAVTGAGVVLALLSLKPGIMAYLETRNVYYVLTNWNVYEKTGVWSTNVACVGIANVQNTQLSKDFWGNLFDYGSVVISTAGSSGAEITFDGIPDAKTVRDRIDELRAKRVNRRDDGVSRAPAADSPTGSTPASAEQLDELIEEVRATRKAFDRIEERVVQGATERAPDGSEGTVTPPTAEAETTSAEADPADEDDSGVPDPKR